MAPLFLTVIARAAMVLLPPRAKLLLRRTPALRNIFS